MAQEKDLTYLNLEKTIRDAESDSLRIEALLQLNSYILQGGFGDIEPKLTLVEQELQASSSYLKSEHTIWLYKQSAIAARRKAKYQEAITFYLEALNIIETTRVQRNQGPIYYNIGVVFDELKDYDKAMHYFKEAVQQWGGFATSEGLANVYNRIGLVHKKQMQLDSALFYYEKAGRLYNSVGSEEGYYRLLNNMGSLYTKKKDYNKAIEMKLRSLVYYQRDKKYESQSIIHYSLGTNYGRLEEYEKALRHLDTSISLAEKYKLQERRKRGYKRIGQVYYKKKDYQNAFIEQEKYFLLTDSLNKMEKSNELELLMRTQEAEKNKALAQLNLEKQQATTYRNYIIMIVLALLVLALIAWQRKVSTVSQLKAKLLRQELKEKERSLKMKENEVSDLLSESVVYMQQKRTILEELEATEGVNYGMQSLIAELKADKLEESKRLLIRQELLQKNSGFLDALRLEHPGLSDLDFELCALIHLGLDRKKIAELKGTSIEAVKKSRYRLRKKLNLSKGMLLQTYLEVFGKR